MLQFERQLWARGFTRVAGVDEAGRGPLAGPVVAAAVVFVPAYAEVAVTGDLAGLTDSKKLTRSQRELFFDRLQEEPRATCGVGIADVAEIDSMNILRATHLAMSRAIAKVGGAAVEHILVDGLAVEGLPCASTPIVKGDSRSLSIAAASIIAKVTRDRMLEVHRSSFRPVREAAEIRRRKLTVKPRARQPQRREHGEQQELF